MTYELYSRLGGMIYGTSIGDIKGDTRSLDYGSYVIQGVYGVIGVTVTVTDA